MEAVLKTNQAIEQSRHEAAQRVKSALKAAIGLPEQIDRLTGEVGKLVDVANAQRLLAVEEMQRSENLSRQTDGLISQVAELVIISGEQKKYAAKLERQTNKLIALSWGLVIFSFVLLIVALIQTRIMFKENPEAHVPQIQTGQHQ
jgi:hypothetical protein